MSYLENLENEFNNIDNVANKVFNVNKVQLKATESNLDLPNAYGIYKETGGRCLGVVGKDFVPTQPKIILDMLTESLYQNNIGDVTKLTFKELKGGSKILFSMPLKQISFKNIRGLDDVSDLVLNFQTGFDGTTKNTMFLSMYRLVCTNGMKVMSTEFSTSFKNTSNNQGKLISLTPDILRTVGEVDNLKDILKRMNQVQVNQAQVDDYLTRVTGYTKEKELSTKAKNILDNLIESIEREFKDSGSNVWGLLNGVTRYTNHVQQNRSNDKLSHLFVDGGAKLNAKAEKEAILMLN